MKRIILSILIIIIFSCSEELFLVKEGKIIKVEYLQGNWNSNDKTIIYFEDNTSWILNYHIGFTTNYIYLYISKNRIRGGEYVYSYKIGERYNEKNN